MEAMRFSRKMVNLNNNFKMARMNEMRKEYRHNGNVWRWEDLGQQYPAYRRYDSLQGYEYIRVF